MLEDPGCFADVGGRRTRGVHEEAEHEPFEKQQAHDRDQPCSKPLCRPILFGDLIGASMPSRVYIPADNSGARESGSPELTSASHSRVVGSQLQAPEHALGDRSDDEHDQPPESRQVYDRGRAIDGPHDAGGHLLRFRP